MNASPADALAPPSALRRPESAEVLKESGGWVSVLIPARNESLRILKTIEASRDLPAVKEIIVIDDASEDGTGILASQSGVTVIKLAERRGKGGALNAGLEKSSGKIILTLDADLGMSASNAADLISCVLEKGDDMAVAVFPELLERASRDDRQGGRGGFGLALKLARWGIERLTGVSFIAPLSGQRAISRGVLVETKGFFPGFGAETALSGWCALKGRRVREIPLPMSHRRTGRDVAGVLHRARQMKDIARALVWLWMVRGNARPK